MNLKEGDKVYDAKYPSLGEGTVFEVGSNRIRVVYSGKWNTYEYYPENWDDLVPEAVCNSKLFKALK